MSVRSDLRELRERPSAEMLVETRRAQTLLLLMAAEYHTVVQRRLHLFSEAAIYEFRTGLHTGGPTTALLKARDAIVAEYVGAEANLLAAMKTMQAAIAKAEAS